MNLSNLKVTAIVVEDNSGSFTVSLADKGGPVVSDKSYKKATAKFEEALKLSASVNNLYRFYDAVKASAKNKEKRSKDIGTPDFDIKYVDA